jgi:methyl-accepting chemotaxis protein
LAIALGSIIVYIISKSISGNLNRVVSLADKISVGELNVEPLKYNGRDEIGRLSGSINKMLYKLQEMIGEITESSCKVDEESKSLMEIASEVQQRSGQIAATMEEMSAGAEEQASSASEIANSIFNFTDLIDNANTNKEALQVSSEDISAVIAEGSEQMEASIETMNHVNEILKGTVSNVKQLENNSEKISVLVHIINDIAEQTNLLALNAAIEAARAGEVGKGFAVVADEIGKLAEQVAKSVKEIKDIVTGIQVESKSMADSLEKGYQSVQEGTTGIKSAGEVFVRINTEINTMAERIKNVAMNLDEISQNSKKINTAADQIAAISEENSAGIQETVASIEEENSSMEIITENANSLANSAQLLKQLVGQFKI